MIKNKYLVLIASDLLSIVSFFFGSRYLFNKLYGTINEVNMWAFIVPGFIFSLLLVFRIHKSIRIVSAKSNDQMVSPLSAAGVALLCSLGSLPQISDFSFASIYFIIFSFIFSRSALKKTNYGRIRYIAWSLVFIIPIILALLNVPKNSEELGYLIYSEFFIIVGLTIFVAVIDALLKKKEKQIQNQDQ